MKKTVTLILAICMLMSLLPVAVFAEEAGLKNDKTYIVLMPGNFTDNGGWTLQMKKVTTECRQVKTVNR